MLNKFPGEEKVYTSAVTVNNDYVHLPEFINKLSPSGFPQHKLKLKEGYTVTLLRNLDAQQGHSNGTWCIVERLGNHIIEALRNHQSTPRQNLNDPQNTSYLSGR